MEVLKDNHINMIKVYKGKKLDILRTIYINTPSARTENKDRKSLSEIIERRKRAQRDARLVKMF